MGRSRMKFGFFVHSSISSFTRFSGFWKKQPPAANATTHHQRLATSRRVAGRLGAAGAAQPTPAKPAPARRPATITGLWSQSRRDGTHGIRRGAKRSSSQLRSWCFLLSAFCITPDSQREPSAKKGRNFTLLYLIRFCFRFSSRLISAHLSAHP